MKVISNPDIENMMRFRIILIGFLLLTANISLAAVSFDFAGRFEFDYSHYDDDDFTKFPSNENDIRRFRFGLFSKFNEAFSSYFQTDFSNYDSKNKASTQAAWIRYRLNKSNEFHLGKMEMPFSLESVSNSKYHFFMERSLSSALSERFGVGANYTHYGKDWNLRIGVFGDDHYKLGSSVNYGKAITGRIGKKYKVFGGRMYMGLSLQYREPDEIIKVRSLVESHTTNIRLLDTDEIAFVNSIEKTGLEALWKNNDWTFQTEYIQNTIKREFGPDLNYNGGYLIASRIFNGQRRFSFRKGEWASTKVKNYKTWELSARYSYLDLQTSELKSGYERNLSIGINYYLSKKNRIMFNYINAKALPNSSAVNENINIYQVRFQFEF